MNSVMVLPASCLMALVTSSLVSRTAMSGSTGTFQALMAARTWSRASAAAAGPAVSRWRRECRSVGRMGALVIMGLLRGRLDMRWLDVHWLDVRLHEKWCGNLQIDTSVS